MQPEKEHAVILYDGVCNLCSGTVRFIAKRDPSAYFQFAALQSDKGREALTRYTLPADEMKTIVLIEKHRAFTRSAAVLRIARGLHRAWPLLTLLLIVPRPLRDACYGFVAARRYRWFGAKPACELPPESLKPRFL